MRYFKNQRLEPAGLTCRYMPPESASRVNFLPGVHTAFLQSGSVSMGVQAFARGGGARLSLGVQG